MDNVIVLTGPTASGKTKLSVKLAQEINGEIISADSMQVYKYMDIGTAKPDEEEMKGIRHYLVDEIYPDEEFSVARYRELAVRYIKEILDKGKIPIIIGGTGLYVNSLIYNITFTEIKSDWDFRENLKNEAMEKGNTWLYEKLKMVDPDAAKSIHKNDVKRLIRALEVFEHTNKPISHHKELSRKQPPEYRFIMLGLKMDREILYERIDKRVDLMFEKGLVNEVRRLIELGYGKSLPVKQGLGYKEIIWYLKGEATFREVSYLLKRNTRHYAKRQMTWFNNINDIHWINVDNIRDESEIIKNVNNYIATYGIFL